MINSFANYLKLGKAKQKTPDPEEADALFEKAEGGILYVKMKSCEEQTAQFVLEEGMGLCTCH